MRDVMPVVLQVLLSVLLAGVAMPILLFALPPAHTAALGLPLAFALLVVCFVGIRMVWPRRKS